MTPTPQYRDLFSKRWRNAVVQAHREVSFQIQLVSMLRWCLRPDVIFFHCPNGGLRENKREAAKLRAMGVLPGVSDLMFFWRPVNSFRALFLELKRPGGKLTTEQAAFGLVMRTMGADFEVAISIDEAIAAVGMRGLIRPGVEVCGRRWS